MKTFTVEQMKKLLNGEIIQGSADFQIKNVIFPWHVDDIRSPHTLVFYKNKRFEWSAIPKNLPLVVVTNKVFAEFRSFSELIVIKVDDVTKAYWKFVQYYRSLFDIPVVAVTGTCGKSTTKEMIKHILSAERKIQATRSSENSRLLHLSYLLGIDDSTDAAVFETAVGAPNDLKIAGRYYKPMIGIITNIGEEHLDHCKSIETYIQAKADMLNGLNNEGILILNADDEKIKTISLADYKGRVVYFSIKKDTDFYASNICYENNGMKFTLEFHKMKYPVFVPGYGEHQVYNALAAIAAVHELGIGIKEAGERLKSFVNLKRHIEIVQGISGSTIIDDTWSLNTTSLRAGLKVLNQMAQGKTRVLFLTDIETLGEMSWKIHKLAEEIIVSEGIDILVTVGDITGQMVEHFKTIGLEATVYSLKDCDEAYELLKKILHKDCILLIKGPMFNKSMAQMAVKLKQQ
ncbi:MAG: UDP-N-acetylmuramoyl-tripeptide--D-alanyl-D-alanine ligase [Herbinix sp.]|nr:UDP-N-acetylmuramoyl-tripeptide--D-alanyl-D-alanine ligase [Herbinix sp.]